MKVRRAVRVQMVVTASDVRPERLRALLLLLADDDVDLSDVRVDGVAIDRAITWRRRLGLDS